MNGDEVWRKRNISYDVNNQLPQDPGRMLRFEMKAYSPLHLYTELYNKTYNLNKASNNEEREKVTNLKDAAKQHQFKHQLWPWLPLYDIYASPAKQDIVNVSILTTKQHTAYKLN